MGNVRRMYLLLERQPLHGKLALANKTPRVGSMFFYLLYMKQANPPALMERSEESIRCTDRRCKELPYL